MDRASPDPERPGDQEAHGSPITAVECKRNPHPLAVVAADLTNANFIHCNALVPAKVAIGQ